MFDTIEDLEKALQAMFIKNIGIYFGCSAGHYDYLPTLSCFSKEEITELVNYIDDNIGKDLSENISAQEAGDVAKRMICYSSYIGMAIAHIVSRGDRIRLSEIRNKFFSINMPSGCLPNQVIRFIGKDIESHKAKEINKLFNIITGNAFSYIYQSQDSSKSYLILRGEATMKMAMKAGYNFYFRDKGIIKGHDADEDQKIIDRLGLCGIDQENQSEERIGQIEKYGALMLKALDENQRQEAYSKLEEIEEVFPEAGVALGQYYFEMNRQTARRHFKIAADAHIHEGEWGYAGTIIHSSVPRKDIANDVEWEKYCLRAAEGGCPDAANEMGNICNRRGCIVEAAYWYGMAYFLEHPQGLIGVKGILQKWLEAGKPEDYKAGTDHYTNERHQAAVLFLKGMSDKPEFEKMERLYLRGEVLAGLFYGYLFQKGNANDYAYDAYNMLLLEDCPHPHIMRCCADMLASGTGTEKDVDEAFRLYTRAAKEGNAPSMYALGQKAMKEGNKDLAAGWFGMAYVRGYDLAGESLATLIE